MIPLIKYNEPTISDRYYNTESFINLKEINEIFIEKPSRMAEISSSVMLNQIIFSGKILETNDGIFLTNLNFINTEENRLFLDAFEDHCFGVVTKGIGKLEESDGKIKVINAELIGLYLTYDPKEANAQCNFNFEFDCVEPKIMLEFIYSQKDLENSRYGSEYISRETKLKEGQRKYPY